jgi:hypothetical protein
MTSKEIKLIQYALQFLLAEWDEEIKHELKRKDITKKYIQDTIDSYIERTREIGYEL